MLTSRVQKDFTCELTGHSNLTFFDAYESEVCLSFMARADMENTDKRQNAKARQLDIVFPEALREPILKRVQFSVIGRLEHLGTLTLHNKMCRSIC